MYHINVFKKMYYARDTLYDICSCWYKSSIVTPGAISTYIVDCMPRICKRDTSTVPFAHKEET